VKDYKRKVLVAAIVAAIASTSGCAVNPPTDAMGMALSVKQEFDQNFNNPDPCADNSMNLVAIGGALLGAVIGGATEGVKGAVAGVIVGLSVGALVGHLVDHRACELSKIAKTHNLDMESTQLKADNLGMPAAPSQGAGGAEAVGLDVQIKGADRDFVPGTAQLTPAAESYLKEVAVLYTPENQVAKIPKTATAEEKAKAANRTVLIVGHADEQDGVQGETLAKLSDDRARAVAEVFAKAGVPASKINYQGAGDTQPAVSASAQGTARKANNRVQIVDVPDEKALEVYAAKRTANPAHFKVAVPATSAPAPVAASSPAATPKPEAVAKKDASMGLSFGGSPLQGDYTIDLGMLPAKGSFLGIISSAHADTPVMVGSCHGDSPRHSTGIKNLATGKELLVRDALPGLYGQPWGGQQGNAFVLLDHVYVPSDVTAPVPNVTVEFFKITDGKPHKPARHMTKNAPVNVYRGSKATLYRVFVDGPAQCVDLYVPTRSGTGEGTLIYPDKGLTHKAVSPYKSLG